MDEKQATDWGITITGKRTIKGGEALEITLEVKYAYLSRAIETLRATPFAAYIPSVAKIIAFLKSLYVEEEIPTFGPRDQGVVTSESNKKEA